MEADVTDRRAPSLLRLNRAKLRSDMKIPVFEMRRKENESNQARGKEPSHDQLTARIFLAVESQSSPGRMIPGVLSPVR